MKDITIRTEVVGLELTLKEFERYKALDNRKLPDGIGFGVVEVTLNGKKIAQLPANATDFPVLAGAFERRDQEGQNWFDTILATIDRSLGDFRKEVRKQ